MYFTTDDRFIVNFNNIHTVVNFEPDLQYLSFIAFYRTAVSAQDFGLEYSICVYSDVNQFQLQHLHDSTDFCGRVVTNTYTMDTQQTRVSNFKEFVFFSMIYLIMGHCWAHF